MRPVEAKIRTEKQDVNLYFDAETGLLVRMVRYADTAVGKVPTQINFSDYRDVNGVKFAFKFESIWPGCVIPANT